MNVGVSPTATWPPNPPSKTGRAYNQTEELTCLTRVVKPIEHDKGESHDQPIIGLKDPPTIVLDRDDLGRNEDGTKQTLQVITESHEENNLCTGNLRQDVEVSSPTSLVADGKRINRSITQTLKPNANVSTPENSSPLDLNARPSANVIDDKQGDAKCFQPFTTYVSNPATPLESVTAKTGLHSLGGIPLITPLEPDDKEMPKARRSKSVGQFPSTPSKHKGTNGNSKSLPPNRHRASPPKDMVRKPSKGGRDSSSIMSDFFLPKGSKTQTSKFPLRRAGLPNLVATGKEPKDVSAESKNHSTDVPMIDIDRIILEEEKRINEIVLARDIQNQAEAVQLIRDAGEKWLSQMPNQKRNDIEKFAVQFLLAMDSTLCFFIVSLRMIALAPWKDSMVAIDVRQAAVVAISRGWFVKGDPFNAYPFTRAELALAAGSYLGKISPNIADDATVALRAIVELLPIACDGFFAQVSLACPFCQAKAAGANIFNSHHLEE